MVEGRDVGRESNGELQVSCTLRDMKDGFRQLSPKGKVARRRLSGSSREDDDASREEAGVSVGAGGFVGVRDMLGGCLRLRAFGVRFFGGAAGLHECALLVHLGRRNRSQGGRLVHEGRGPSRRGGRQLDPTAAAFAAAEGDPLETDRRNRTATGSSNEGFFLARPGGAVRLDRARRCGGVRASIRNKGGLSSVGRNCEREHRRVGTGTLPEEGAANAAAATAVLVVVLGRREHGEGLSRDLDHIQNDGDRNRRRSGTSDSYGFFIFIGDFCSGGGGGGGGVAERTWYQYLSSKSIVVHVRREWVPRYFLIQFE
jgi:hypothetical protein